MKNMQSSHVLKAFLPHLDVASSQYFRLAFVRFWRRSRGWQRDVQTSAAGLTEADTTLLNNRVYVGLIVGAMLPYWFSALTMKSVGTAALAMVEEVRVPH